MTINQYITRFGILPYEVEVEFQRGWNKVQSKLDPRDRMKFPQRCPIELHGGYHTTAKGMWAPFGKLWMAPDCWKRAEWKPTHSYGFASNIHEIVHVAQWRKLGAVSWAWNLAWASLLQVTGRTWHSAGFERQAIRIQTAVRDAVNADPKWNHRLRSDFKNLLDRNDF